MWTTCDISLNSEMFQYRYNLLNKLNPTRRFLFTTKFCENLRTVQLQCNYNIESIFKLSCV